jgi:hypothetical protein
MVRNSSTHSAPSIVELSFHSLWINALHRPDRVMVGGRQPARVGIEENSNEPDWALSTYWAPGNRFPKRPLGTWLAGRHCVRQIRGFTGFISSESHF